MKDRIQTEMTLYEKLEILSDAAKYDVACTSSGVDRKGDGTGTVSYTHLVLELRPEKK